MLVANLIRLDASAESCVHATFAAHREHMLVREVLEYFAQCPWPGLVGEGLRDLSAIALSQLVREETEFYMLQVVNVPEPI